MQLSGQGPRQCGGPSGRGQSGGQRTQGLASTMVRRPFFFSTRPRLVQGARLALDGFSPPTTPRPRTISAHHPQGKVCKPTRRKTLQGQLVRNRRGYIFLLLPPQGFLKIATCLSPWCPSGVPECRDGVNGGTASVFLSSPFCFCFVDR